MVLAGEYRQLHTNGYTQIAAGGTYASLDEGDRESEEGKEFRGYSQGHGGYGVSDHSVAGYDVYLTTDNTFLDRYGIDNRRCCEPHLPRGPGGPQFLVGERLLLPGSADHRRPGQDPGGPAIGRDAAGQRPVDLGLLFHRRFERVWR